jgi:methylenetetrahydrofolate dehydrogenase (NADP+)/methenyltetrahydrofolate cyclohydrolase
MKILDGKIVRDQISQNLKLKIARPENFRRENLKLKPKLVIIQVGDNSESNAYISQKIKFGEKIGAIIELKKFPADVSEETLNSQVSILNSNHSVHGIIIQLPVSDRLDKDKLIELIDPKKDIDGLTTTNQKLLLENNPNAVVPATAKGIITILNYYKIPIKGKKVTVVGRSKLVGAPVATLFRNLGAQVTVCHSQTPDLKAETKNADIIVVAVGKPNLIGREHVSPNQVVVDVGINVEEVDGNRKLIGDVNFAEVYPIVSAITPVPGGVGPMTVASLFENLLEAHKKQTI